MRGDNPFAMTALSARELLRLPVRLHGIQLGRPTDVILDPDRRRVVGFDVACGDETRRFLPLSAAAVGQDEISVGSPLLLLDERELAFYTSRGSALTSLRGCVVSRARAAVGTLDDLVIAADGTVVAVVVDAADGSLRLPYDEETELGVPRRVPRAS